MEYHQYQLYRPHLAFWPVSFLEYRSAGAAATGAATGEYCSTGFRRIRKYIHILPHTVGITFWRTQGNHIIDHYLGNFSLVTILTGKSSGLHSAFHKNFAAFVQ
jgi:hypothetical protein